eukprot:15433104-Alexandrium_andersonii.AAC.1
MEKVWAMHAGEVKAVAAQHMTRVENFMQEPNNAGLLMGALSATLDDSEAWLDAGTPNLDD